MPINSKSLPPCVVKTTKIYQKPLFLILALCLSFLLCACGTGQKEPSPLPKERTSILYIDAGHGGFDNGAVGVTADGEAVREKDVTLAISRLVADGLREAGYTVLLSRVGDERLTYTTARDEVIARRAAAQAAGADLLLSIHVNAYAGEGRAYGARVYHHPDCASAATLAAALSETVTEYTLPQVGRACRTVSDGSFYVLSDPALPALLFEVGFITDREELSLLTDPAYRERLADAVCKALSSLP